MYKYTPKIIAKMRNVSSIGQNMPQPLSFHANFSVLNSGYVRLVDFVFSCNLLLRSIVLFYLFDLIYRKSSVAIFLPKSISAFFYRILIIYKPSSYKKMIGVYASGIITFMANNKIIAKITKKQTIRLSMRPDLFFVFPYHSITRFISKSSPFPASVFVYREFFKNSIFQTFFFDWKRFKRSVFSHLVIVFLAKTSTNSFVVAESAI